jgi:hypothetical protein
MLEFVTAARQHPESAIADAEPITFTVDGEEFTAHPPTPGQLALIMAAQTSRSMTERIAAIIDFMDCLLDESGQERFRDRLMDRDDPFDVEQVQEVISGLMEEWTARPTQRSSDSSSSQASTGRSSTVKRRSGATTSSTSRSVGS